MDTATDDSGRFVLCSSCGGRNAEFNLRCAACGEPIPGRTAEPKPPPREIPEGSWVSHYQVLESLGRGGMGTVYRALDSRLRRHVALKFLAEELAPKSNARIRFLREARAASALDHPNLGTVHDIGEHDGRPFLVLALYEGETLRERLKRGPIEVAEAESILTQICAGLAAAHQAGIVHRDLKPANVMLTRSGQVKILDFGLAKLIDSLDESDTAVTGIGQPVGTVAYMSPEQACGKSIDHRTDLWSLGVVAYEMLSGVHPFQALGPVATLGRILSEEPRPLEELRENLPSQLTSAISALLSKEVAQRPASAAEAFTRRSKGEPNPTEQTPGSGQGGTVAVLGFKNTSGQSETAWLSTALSEMLGTELAAGNHLRILPGETVARMKVELALAETDGYGRDTLARIRRNLGADQVVLGSYIALKQSSGSRLRLDVRVQDTRAGETVAAVAEAGTESDLFDLITRVGTQLRERLSLGQRSEAEARGVRASLPVNLEAARFYSEGLARLRLFDALGARERLEKAVAAEPGHPLPHWALAEVWTQLGYPLDARAEATKAFELSNCLPRRERIALKARHHETLSEWSAAIESYRLLWDLFPDQIEYGMQLAYAQCEAARGQDALATLEVLRKLPATEDDPRMDLLEAEAADWIADSRMALEASTRAKQKGMARGAWLLAARAMIVEGQALHRGGEPQRAMSTWLEARRLYAAAGHARGEGRVLLQMGWLYQSQEDHARALPILEEALAVCRNAGLRLGMATALSYLGWIARRKCLYSTARAHFDEARSHFEAVGSRMRAALRMADSADSMVSEGELSLAQALFEKATLTAREAGSGVHTAQVLLSHSRWFEAKGDTDGVRRKLDEALLVAREVGAKNLVARCLTSIGDCLARTGQLDSAVELYEESTLVGQTIELVNAMAWPHLRLARVETARDNLSAARQHLRDARALRLKTGRDSYALIWLAELTLEEGNPAAAAEAASALSAEYRADGWTPDEARSQLILALALLSLGKLDEARTAVARATDLAEANRDVTLSVRTTLARARIRAVAGSTDAAESMAELRAALERSISRGHVGLQFEARLALGQVLIASVDRNEGVDVLEKLERDAGGRGFRLIARKAADARAGSAASRDPDDSR